MRALDLKGIGFVKESRRFYPKRELLAHVLGYVGLDDAGLAGIESASDVDDPRPRRAECSSSCDAKRRVMTSHVEREPRPARRWS